MNAGPGFRMAFIWRTCWALAQWFPSLNAALGAHGSFWVFGIICLAGFLFVLFFLPETKGRTLEDIERELTGDQQA